MDPASRSLKIIRAMAGAADDVPRGVIRAYHGSPHSFSRFDASKIGTGEGAQSYGHGLYFAGAEDTARTYRDALAPTTAVMPDGTVLKRPWWLTDKMIAGQLDDQRENWARRVQAAHDAGISPEPWASELRAMDAIAGGTPFTPSGHMYEVELGVPEDTLLDWDRPLSTSAAAVGAAIVRDRNPAAMPLPVLRAIEDGSWRFESFPDRNPYDGAAHNIARLAKSPEGARALMEAGVPGVRYLDGDSRSVGTGTRNYVMFPGTEDRIRILRQYGLLPPLVGAAAMEEE